MARSHKLRRSRTESDGAATNDLYDYAGPPVRRRGRAPKHDPTRWTVTDDWPADIPVTEAEVDVFEAWFGDLFDELFATQH